VSAKTAVEEQTRKQAVSLGPLRSLSAIAQSYQRFLLFALMSYLPPDPSADLSKLLTTNVLTATKGVSGACYQQGKNCISGC
jgi:hypothetical protein